MQKGLAPTRTTLCGKCRSAPSRYYGSWGTAGLCRECILGLEASTRRKVLRGLHPEDRKRWQIDELAEQVRQREQRQRELEERREDDRRSDDRHSAPSQKAANRSHPPGQTGSQSHPRRRHTRIFAELPVRFYVAVGCGRVSAALSGRAFRALSKDVSEGGIRIQVRDPRLLDVPAGCNLRLEISMPFGIPVVRCTGVVRNLVRTSRGRDASYLCVQFDTFTAGSVEEIHTYISRSSTPTAD